MLVSAVTLKLRAPAAAAGELEHQTATCRHSLDTPALMVYILWKNYILIACCVCNYCFPKPWQSGDKETVTLTDTHQKLFQSFQKSIFCFSPKRMVGVWCWGWCHHWWCKGSQRVKSLLCVGMTRYTSVDKRSPDLRSEITTLLKSFGGT